MYLDTTDATCAFINPLSLVVKGNDSDLRFDPEGFTAGFRTNQYNHVSVGVSQGIVAGGYSFGGAGRGNSEQWPIEGGTLEVDLLQYNIFDGAADEFYIDVKWSGASIENFSGEEASGTVEILCVFAVDY